MFKICFMRNYAISGAIGAIVIILFLLGACVLFEPFQYKPVYIVNPQKVVDSITINGDSLTCAHIETLKDLENKGLLLTPSEYTSQISSYYSTLVAFLIGLFVLFTIGSIYSIRITSKKEIEDAKRDLDNREAKIKEELKDNIQKSLNELVKDSISFKENVVTAIYGRIEDDIITRKDIENIENKVQKTQENINLLFESIDEVLDKKTSKDEIE